MFHSSGSRHEQYIVRSSPSKATLHKKRVSLESELSGADSGYNSSSSSPSESIAKINNNDLNNHVIADISNFDDTMSTTTTLKSTIDNTSCITSGSNTPLIKKKKSRRNQPPRQPDLVYSCPRPLAFPFHNDDHFLPIAEADPRDVAKVSPGLNRASSLYSNKSSIGTTRMYDNCRYSTYSNSGYSNRPTEAESIYSRQSSILSTMQRGTVRSIRSLFQLRSENLSNDKGLDRVDSIQSAATSQYTNTSQPSHLQKLEIKKGTVQSIKEIFSFKRTSRQATRVTLPPAKQQNGRVGATIGRFESSSSSISDFSRSAINNDALNKKPTATAAATVTATATTATTTTTSLKPSKTKSFRSRAAEFASRALWKPKTNTLPTATATVTKTKPPSQAPITGFSANTTAPPKTLKSQVKKISAKITSSLPKSWNNSSSKNRNNNRSTEASSNASLPVPAIAAPKAKKSLFSSFKRSDVSASVDNLKKGISTTEESLDATVNVQVQSTVGKMWKSFKNLVSGKKSSRVGIL